MTKTLTIQLENLISQLLDKEQLENLNTTFHVAINIADELNEILTKYRNGNYDYQNLNDLEE